MVNTDVIDKGQIADKRMWKTLEIIGFEQSTKLQPYFQKRPTADGFQVKNRIFRRTKGNVDQRIILSASVAEFSNQNPRLIVCRAILHYRPTLGGQFAISLLFLCRTVDIQSCFFLKYQLKCTVTN